MLPTVAIVAADRRIRDSLASLLGATGQVRLVGSAGDAESAVRLAAAGRAEVIVVDPSVANGRTEDALLPLLRGAAPGARILLLEWESSPGHAPTPTAADAVLDPASHPTALIDAVLSSRTAGD